MTTQVQARPLPFVNVRPAGPSRLKLIGRGIWRVLTEIGLRRSRGAILQLAREVDASRPELAAQLREAARRGWQ